MPAIYAHDKFGKLVSEQLQGELKNVIETYYPQFRIGLQGPDPLFYHRPYLPDEATKEGSFIHRQPCSDFLKNAIHVIRREGIDSGEYAYLLGFICHFTLDSECHPYIDSYIQQRKVGHIELESEFEKFMMRKDHLDPIHTDISNYIPTDVYTAQCMAPFYKHLDEKKAHTTLKEMHFEKHFLYAPKPVKQKIMNTIFHLTGHYDDIGGLMLQPVDNPECSESNTYLYKRFFDSIPLAIKLLHDLNDTIQNGVVLNNRFRRNFETKE